MLPIVDELQWTHLTVCARPFARENAISTKNSPDESRTLGNRNLGKSPAAEKKNAAAWFATVSLSILVVILYAPVLGSLGRQWLDDPNYGHGIFVPIFAAYVLWRERDRWSALPVRGNNFGLMIMLFAIALLALGTLGAELFTARLSLVILICGIVVFMTGYRVLRSIAFPVGYLVLMIPLPAMVYYQMTLPLQLLASRLGASGLVALDIHTIREGNLLILPNCTLNVVEACSGIRSLLSLLAAVVAFGYLVEPRFWKRCALAFATIPIAIATNGLRLATTGVLSFYFRPAVDSDVVHLSLGLAFFSMAFLSVVLIHKMLRQFPRFRKPRSAYT